MMKWNGRCESVSCAKSTEERMRKGLGFPLWHLSPLFLDEETDRCRRVRARMHTA